MVAQFYICYMVKKCINTIIAVALYLEKALKVAYGSGHQRGLQLVSYCEMEDALSKTRWTVVTPGMDGWGS